MTPKQNLPLKKEFSAGGVVFKKSGEEAPLFLLGKHSGYHKWVLPKGLVEENEEALEAAVREVEEETGVGTEPVLEKPLHKERYFYVSDYENEEKARVSKTVVFFLLRFKQGSPARHGPEMEEAGWFRAEEALDRMGFGEEKKALKKGRDFVSRELRRRRKLF